MRSGNLRDNIIIDLVNIIKRSTLEGYAFKGGYILKTMLPNGFRETVDLDMSIESIEVFNSILKSIIPYVEDLKYKGLIHKYTVKTPIKGKVSGGIKMYKKPNENTRMFLFCGVDISIHDLSYGVIKFDGGNTFSPSRMVSDKLTVMYSDRDTILRRCRDLYDIYLIGVFIGVNKEELLIDIVKSGEAKGFNINRKSVLESLFYGDGSFSSMLINKLNTLLSNGVRVNRASGMTEKVKPIDLILYTTRVLESLRGC